jgi:hypothetical protein
MSGAAEHTITTEAFVDYLPDIRDRIESDPLKRAAALGAYAQREDLV